MKLFRKVQRIWYLFTFLLLSFISRADNITTTAGKLIIVNETTFTASTNITWSTTTRPFKLTGVLVRQASATAGSVTVDFYYRGSTSYTLVAFSNGTSVWQSACWISEGNGIWLAPQRGDYLKITGPGGSSISVLLQAEQ